MSKPTPALIDTTTDAGLLAARNFMYTHLIHALVDAPASVRNLVGRCKMHEFFGLFKQKMVQGAHWHSHDGLFVRYQQYRAAEQVFVQCRYAFYPELMPDKFQLRTDPKMDSDNVGQLADWGGGWALHVFADKQGFMVDTLYPQAAITDNTILLIPKGEGVVIRAWVQQVKPDGLFIRLSYTNDISQVFAQLRTNISLSQPFFVYTPPE